jgi:hypothetical protein
MSIDGEYALARISAAKLERVVALFGLGKRRQQRSFVRHGLVSIAHSSRLALLSRSKGSSAGQRR